MRSTEETVSIKHVYIRNQNAFYGSTYEPKNELAFRSYIKQGIYELKSDEELAVRFVKEEYDKHSKPVLDMVVEKEHTVSISFVWYHETIRESDGYEELQLYDWSIVVQYNIDDEVVFPITLTPVDADASGKYWRNRLGQK